MILKASAALALSNTPANRFSVDLFCRVIDNFGDAGVCLRLARALVLHHDCSVRLFCDDVALLVRLEPTPPMGLQFCSWQAQQHATPAQGVVCGFGCTLEAQYLAKLASAQPQPAYLHLDYLSAEPWVETTHGHWMLHPRLATRQRFCNPGFNERTGGLLHEPAAYSQALALATLSQWGSTVPADALRVFVFAYLTDCFKAFVRAAALAMQPIHWVLPQGAAGQQVWLALQGRAQHSFTRLPFVSQTQFDAALRSCQRAWVRGEDSAITALFAGVPMVWQLYPQDDGAHRVKTQAYIDTVERAVGHTDPLAFARWRGALCAANGVPLPTAIPEALATQGAQVWFDFLNPSAAQPQLQAQALAQAWALHCAARSPDLGLTVSSWLKNWTIH